MSANDSIREVRLQKLARLRELGLDPFSVERFEPGVTLRGLIDGYSAFEGRRVPCVGRIVSHRLMGKAGFAHISDGELRLQAYFRKDDLTEAEWEAYNLLDVGDHIGLEGEMFTTKTGEKTLHVRRLVPLSKALNVLPIGKEKEGQSWYGLSDVDLRYRHRHLDLVCNAEARHMLLMRSKIVASIRDFFAAQEYVEVETPILQTVAGGATATPFLTHYNAYELDVKLRISLELYLKRVICGDVPRVFEIGRVFRNEGVSNRHNPEFTLLEFYEAYSGLEDMMQRVEQLFRHVALEVFGGYEVHVKSETEEYKLDFSDDWRRVDLMEEIEKLSGISQNDLHDYESARKALDKAKVPYHGHKSLGGIIEKLLEHFVEPTLIEPTFVVNYPIETSPLAKKNPLDPTRTRRFEGYMRGREICNAFSEINDPIDQRARFEGQLAQRASGNLEAHPMDEDFLFAMESGMPPTGGCGIGIDRIVMLLLGAEVLREVLLFPTMKPDAQENAPQ